MPIKIDLYTLLTLPEVCLPHPNAKDFNRTWFEQDSKTKNHAKFCLPLLMANGIGYNLISPITFTVEWNGDLNSDAQLIIHDKIDGTIVDTHSTHGGFTVQSNLVFRTPENIFTLVKPVPNRRCPFTVMEGLIETWWSPATFGIVALCNSKGTFTIRMGQPIAQVIFIHKDQLLGTEITYRGSASQVPHFNNLSNRRSNYTGKELFYFKGKCPSGRESKDDTPYEGPHYKPGDLKQNTLTLARKE